MDKSFFTVYDGFRFISEKKYMPADEAADILCSKKQRYYSSAEIYKNEAVLYSECFVCPCCGHRLPAYLPFVQAGEAYEKIPRSIIRHWTDGQLSFDDLSTPRKLSLAVPADKNKIYTVTCPRCCHTGTTECIKREAFTASGKNRFTAGISGFPENAYETITFNLCNGRTYIKFYDESGREIRCRDISFTDKSLLSDDAVCRLFEENRRVIRAAYRFLQKQLKNPLPFAGEELYAGLLALLVQFQNYPRSFYSNIPFPKKSLSLEGISKKTVKNMRLAENIPAHVQKLDLPAVKSVRRTLFTNPELLFFGRELEKLYSALNDINLFCRVLEDSFCLQHLCDCRNFLPVADFWKIYAQKRTPKALANLLCRVTSICSYAVDFMSLRQPLRDKEIKKWNSGYMQSVISGDTGRIVKGFNNPISSMPKSGKFLPSYYTCGFSFKMLVKIKDYIKAADGLHNCLESYSPGSCMPVAVQYAGRYVAAILVKGDIITECLGIDNRDIEEDSLIYKAFIKWARHFGLEYAAYKADRMP